MNLYNIIKNLSDPPPPPSLLCQIYADPPFLGSKNLNDPPMNSSGPHPFLKNKRSLKVSRSPQTSDLKVDFFLAKKVSVIYLS